MTRRRRAIAWSSAILLCASLVTTGCTGTAPVDTRPLPVKEADTLISKGVAHYNQAEYAKAGAYFERALHGYRSIDHPEGIASSCINLAKSSLAQGHAQAANRWLDAGQRIIEQNALAPLEPHATIIRSSIAIEEKRLDEARQQLQPLVDAAPGAIDAETRIAAVQNRTRIAFIEGVDAAEWTQRYAALVNSSTPLHEARLERFRAALAQDAPEWNAHYGAALERYRALAHRPGIAATLEEWAAKDMQASEAESRLLRALYIRAVLHDAENSTRVLRQLATVYRASGDGAKAARADSWIAELQSGAFNRWETLAGLYAPFPGNR